MSELVEIKKIIFDALDIGRYAPKTDIPYPFLEPEERLEMTKKVIENLKSSGYRIQKVRKKLDKPKQQ